MRIATFSIASVLLAAAPALADEPIEPLGPFPNLATMDRTTDHSSFNASLGLSFFGDDPELPVDIGLAGRLDLGGQFIVAPGFGGYLDLPVSYFSYEDLLGEEDSQTAMGNLELGGVFVAEAAPTTKVVIAAGVVLPTGPESDGDLEPEELTNLIALAPRMTDHTSASLETTWLRIKASPLHRAGSFFLRADLGFDLAIDEPDDSDTDPMFHANIAAGVQVGGATIAGELVTIGTTGDVEDDQDRFVHSFAVSAGVAEGQVRPYGALVLPIDNDVAELFDLSFAIMAGLEVPITTTR